MRTFKFIGMAFIALMMCVNFSACNKDDDPKDEDLIIGTWISEDEEIYSFEKDGTGEYEFEDGDDFYYNKFKWKISDNKLILSEDGEKEEYTIITLTEDKLVIEFEDSKDSYTTTLTKKGSNNESTSSYEKLIIGTWSDGDDEDFDEYTFNADGTGKEISGEAGKGTYRDSFEWSISGNKITLDFEDDSEYYTIEKLTDDELIWSMKDGDETHRETYSKK